MTKNINRGYMRRMGYEVSRMAGALGWYVFRDGLLDCDVPASPTEAAAWAKAVRYKKRGRPEEAQRHQRGLI